MKKRIISLAIAVMFGCSIYTSAITTYAEEACGETDTVSKGTLLYETEVITQKDYDEGFQNYALSAATVDLAVSMHTFSNNNLANVVGVVRDYDTEAFIPNATISVDGEVAVITGEDGRFQIKNLPSGTYDWEINAAGYFAANYSNYDVDSADGTTIFTFYINDDFSVSQDREEIMHDIGGQTVLPSIIDRGNFATSSVARAMSSVPDVSNSIAVYYNNQTKTVDRETYIYTVLSSELYGKSYYTGKGLTSTQVSELYEAQAVAANTFLEYALSVYSNHSGKDYKVCSSSCCQVYDPTNVTEEAIDATANIFYTSGGKSKTDIVMYKPSSTTYDYIWGAFFSSCSGNGTKDHSTQPALKAVSCTDIATGAGGHRYGLCQMGAALRAKNGDSASNILLYYYTDCRIISCTLK